jgi:hypothetical protein
VEAFPKGEEAMKRIHHIDRIEYDGNTMLLTVNGRCYRIALEKASVALLRATPEERLNFHVSPSGYGIHWPILDEDLSVAGLLKTASFNSKSKKTA